MKRYSLQSNYTVHSILKNILWVSRLNIQSVQMCTVYLLHIALFVLYQKQSSYCTVFLVNYHKISQNKKTEYCDLKTELFEKTESIKMGFKKKNYFSLDTV